MNSASRPDPLGSPPKVPQRLSCHSYPGQVPNILPEGAWGQFRLADQIGHALRVPPGCDIHLASDSTLGLYPKYEFNAAPGRSVRKGEKKWINKFFANQSDSVVRAPWMVCGATIQDITAGLAELSDEDVD